MKTLNAGLYEVSPDHNATLGQDPDSPRFVLVNGFSGHGMQHAPAVRKAISEVIVDGESRTSDISAFCGRAVRRRDDAEGTSYEAAAPDRTPIFRPAWQPSWCWRSRRPGPQCPSSPDSRRCRAGPKAHSRQLCQSVLSPGIPNTSWRPYRRSSSVGCGAHSSVHATWYHIAGRPTLVHLPRSAVTPPRCPENIRRQSTGQGPTELVWQAGLLVGEESTRIATGEACIT